MAGYELPLQVGGKFGDFQAIGLALEVVAIGFRLGGLLQVHDAAVPGRKLHPDVTERFGPLRNRGKRIVRRLVGHKLSKK